MVSFQEALKTDNLEALRLIPKGDLHNHAFGGGNRACISDATGRDIAPVNRPLHSMAEMHEWVGRHIGPLGAERSSHCIRGNAGPGAA